MNLKSIKDKIKTILEADSDLVNTFGLKKVFEGYRNNIPHTDYPCIMIEIAENDEVKNDANLSVGLIGTFSIILNEKVENPDEQLNNTLDFEKYVKKALSQDVKMDGESIDLMFRNTTYEIEFWPIRGAIIPMEVKYKQGFKTRA